MLTTALLDNGRYSCTVRRTKYDRPSQKQLIELLSVLGCWDGSFIVNLLVFCDFRVLLMCDSNFNE